MKSIARSEIASQLERIVASPQLSSSNVLSAFLTFIVQETLDGRAGDLKEYTIGTCALKREVDFNPQLDAIVRIHAGRLRRMLKEYYSENGCSDPVIISIPKGSYVPTFVRNDAATTLGGATKFADRPEDSVNGRSSIKIDIRRPQTRQKSSIVVLPFKTIGRGRVLKDFAEGIAEQLGTELTGFEDLRVIRTDAYNSAVERISEFPYVGGGVASDYVVTGSVQSFGKLVCLYVQLNVTENGQRLWAQTYKCENFEEEYGQFQEASVERIIAAIVGMNGTIARYELKRLPLVSGNEAAERSLAFWYRQYLEAFNVATINSAKEYYLAVLKEDSRNALVAAYLSQILVGESLLVPIMGIHSAELGLQYARTAISMDPFCQQGYLSLAIAYWSLGRIQKSTYALEKGLKVNPRSLDFQGAMGAVLIYSGDFERGGEILNRIIPLCFHTPWWYTLAYSLYFYQRNLYDDALLWAESSAVENVYVFIIKAAIYAKLQRHGNAEAMLKRIKEDYSDVDISEPGLKEIFKSDGIVNELLPALDKLVQVAG